jgi:uncharacterized protein
MKEHIICRERMGIMENIDYTRLDLTGVFAKTVEGIDFDFEIPKEALETEGTIDVPVLRANGKIYMKAVGKSKSEDLVMLEANLSASYTDLCARCLEKTEGKIELPYSACIVRSLTDESRDDEYILAKDSCIDLIDILKTAFLFELPTRSLCKEDCKGLCQECGINLNCGSCDCGKNKVDPRLEKLRELLGKD